MADTEGSALSGKQREQVEERLRPSVAVIFETIRLEAEEELERSSASLAWSGLAAGLSMGFSLLTEGLLHSVLPDRPWRTLIVNFGYTIGFLIVVLGRQQLFTENTLTPVLPLLTKPSWGKAAQVLRLWGIVLLANMVGALVFAWAAVRTGAFPAELKNAFASLAHASMGGEPFWTVVVKGIYAGWLIALLVWILPAAQSERVLVIVILSYLVGLGRFSHIVVGSVEAFYLVVLGDASWGDYFGGFFAPTLLGNVIGGVVLVAFVSHGQAGTALAEGQNGKTPQ